MGSKDVKKEYMEYVKKECRIHIDKPAGKEHCSHMLMGDTVSICTMLASLFEMLIKHNVLDINDLKHIIGLVDKIGDNNESK